MAFWETPETQAKILVPSSYWWGRQAWTNKKIVGHNLTVFKTYVDGHTEQENTFFWGRIKDFSKAKVLERLHKYFKIADGQRATLTVVLKDDKGYETRTLESLYRNDFWDDYRQFYNDETRAQYWQGKQKIYVKRSQIKRRKLVLVDSF